MAQTGPDADPIQIGRYHVEGQLGAGGVGVVYAAHDPELSRPVAVKLLRPDRLGTDPAKAHERLRSEAQAMAQLSHPNVAMVFDVGEHDGGVYIAMELVDGKSMRDWLRETARPWREVLSMFFQAGMGLAAAHDVGMIHRDFKPANVLVGRDGRARVVDFGLASSGGVAFPTANDGSDDVEGTSPVGHYHRPTYLGDSDDTIDESGRPPRIAPADVLETTGVLRTQDGMPLRAKADLLSTVTGIDMTRDGLQTMAPDPGATIPAGVSRSNVIVGTPAYMAPELFLGHTADVRSDLFAFCVSLYEGLYGYRPFTGATPSEIADEVLAGRIAAPPEGTRVPRWIHASIMQGLEVRRQDRHPTVRSMLASIAFLARVVWD